MALLLDRVRLSDVPRPQGILLFFPGFQRFLLTIVVFGAETLPQAEKPSTVYVMRLILHDWDDDMSIKILRSVRTAIGNSGASLLILDLSPFPNILYYFLQVSAIAYRLLSFHFQRTTCNPVTSTCD